MCEGSQPYPYIRLYELWAFLRKVLADDYESVDCKQDILT